MGPNSVCIRGALTVDNGPFLLTNAPSKSPEVCQVYKYFLGTQQHPKPCSEGVSHGSNDSDIGGPELMDTAGGSSCAAAQGSTAKGGTSDVEGICS